MSFFTILDIAIGLIFTFLILSLLASEVQEQLASMFEFRALHLKRAIKLLLGEDVFTADDYATVWLTRDDNPIPVLIPRNKLIELDKIKLDKNGVGKAWLDEQNRIITVNNDDVTNISQDDSQGELKKDTKVKVKYKEIKKLHTPLLKSELEETNKEIDGIDNIDLKKLQPVPLITEVLYSHSLIRDLNQFATGLFNGKLLRLRFRTDTITNLFNSSTTGKSSVNKQSEGPSYIEPGTFATSLLEVIQDQLANEHQLEIESDTIDSIIEKIYTIPFSDKVKMRLVEVAQRIELKAIRANLSADKDKAIAPLQAFRQELELWYQQSIDRSSGVYKRNAKGLSIAVGILIAVLFNINVFNITDALKNQEVRDAFIQSAQTVIQEDDDFVKNCIEKQTESTLTDQEKNNCSERVQQLSETIQDIAPGLKIGWEPDAEIVTQITNEVQKSGGRSIFGWFLTALAISMGSPFWFEILGKVMNVRNSSSQASSSQNESSTNTLDK